MTGLMIILCVLLYAFLGRIYVNLMYTEQSIQIDYNIKQDCLVPRISVSGRSSGYLYVDQKHILQIFVLFTIVIDLMILICRGIKLLTIGFFNCCGFILKFPNNLADFLVNENRLARIPKYSIKLERK